MSACGLRIVSGGLDRRLYRCHRVDRLGIDWWHRVNWLDRIRLDWIYRLHGVCGSIWFNWIFRFDLWFRLGLGFRLRINRFFRFFGWRIDRVFGRLIFRFVLRTLGVHAVVIGLLPCCFVRV